MTNLMLYSVHPSSASFDICLLWHKAHLPQFHVDSNLNVSVPSDAPVPITSKRQLFTATPNAFISLLPKICLLTSAIIFPSTFPTTFSTFLRLSLLRFVVFDSAVYDISISKFFCQICFWLSWSIDVILYYVILFLPRGGNNHFVLSLYVQYLCNWC